MGLGTRLLIMMIVISFFFGFAPKVCSDGSQACYGYGNVWNNTLLDFGQISGGGFTSYFYNNIFALLFGLGAVALFTSAIFPNPYIIFAGISMFLISFATIPYSVLTSSDSLGAAISSPLASLFVIIFSVLFVVAAATWYKGNEW